MTSAKSTQQQLEGRLKKTEHLLGQNDLFPAIVQAAMDGFWIVDEQGRFLEVNAAYCDLIGYSRGELLGMAITDIEAIESQQDIARRIEKIQAAGRDRFMTKHRRKDGRVVDVEISVQHLPVRELFFVFVRDVSDFVREAHSQRVAQEILRLNAAESAAESLLLRTAVENSPVSIVVTGTQGRIEYVNPAFTRITGYTAKEALGGNPRMLKSGKQTRELYADLWAAITAGEEWHGEVVNRRKDGTLYTQQLTIAPSRDAEGRLTHFVAIGQDVTERRQAEEKERESTRVLLDSQKVARLGSYRLDIVAGTWTSSQVLDDVFGIADPGFRKDIPGWLSIVHPDQRSEMQAYFADVVLAKKQRFDREYRIVRLNDGKERWVHGFGDLVTSPEGQLLEMVGTIQDVTERKQLESQFSQAQKLESVGRLAGGVAHDFNNLLTVILGEAEFVLTELPVGDSRRASIEAITAAGQRATGLTRQLLAFSRQQVIQPTTFDLNDMVAEAARMLSRLIGEDIDLVCPTPLDPAVVRADYGQVEQVLLNLVINARDAMPDGGTLSIETRRVTLDEEYARVHVNATPGQYVLLAVSDSGTGIAPDIRAKIFEPFFTTKERSKGTGLGLATCYGIVKQSGGHIEVYSEVGLGTTMNVYFPQARDAAIAQRASGSVLETRGTETILLVEDDTMVLGIAVRMLEAQGYRVLQARSGEGALQLLEGRADHVHLLLSDVVLPGMNGRELSDRVRAQDPAVKVLYTSGYTEDSILRRRLLDQGASLVQKPFTAESLCRKVREILDA